MPKGTPKKGKGRWQRSDWLSLAAVAVSLIALLIPPITSQIESARAPKASISGIEEEQKLSRSDYQVEVSYENKDDDADVWLVLRTGIEGKWYPLRRVLPSEGDLNTGVSEPLDVFLATTGPYQLSVYYTTPSQGLAFQEYLAQPAADQTGMFGIPEGIVELETVSFERSE